MKLLFAYNHELHAAALLRSAGAFAHYGVQFIPTDFDPVPDRLIDWAEVILLQEPPVRDAVVDCGKPVILLERIDGAQLRAAREYLPRVAGVIKGYLFRDRDRNNATFDRAHVEILHCAGITGAMPRHREDSPEPKIAVPDLRRMFAGYGFGAHAHMGRLVETVIDFDVARPYDASFHGIVEYNHSEIETHRKAAVSAVETWPGPTLYGAGRPLRQEDYYLSLLRSRAVLSPWGWGEACHRDYEAMLLGAVLIKPDTSHVKCWPDIFATGKTYVPCEPDFSDAHAKIAHVRDHWDDYRTLRERARHMAQLAWRPGLIAERIVNVVRRLLA